MYNSLILFLEKRRKKFLFNSALMFVLKNDGDVKQSMDVDVKLITNLHLRIQIVKHSAELESILTGKVDW